MNILIQTTIQFKFSIETLNSQSKECYSQHYAVPFEVTVIKLPFISIHLIADKYSGFILDVFQCGLKNNFPKDSREFERLVKTEVETEVNRVRNSWESEITRQREELTKLNKKVGELTNENITLKSAIRLVEESNHA